MEEEGRDREGRIVEGKKREWRDWALNIARELAVDESLSVWVLLV